MWWAVGAPKGDDSEADDSSLFAFSLPPGRDASLQQVVPFLGAVDPEGVAVLAPGTFAVADEADQSVLVMRTQATGSGLAQSMAQATVEVRSLCYPVRQGLAELDCLYRAAAPRTPVAHLHDSLILCTSTTAAWRMCCSAAFQLAWLKPNRSPAWRAWRTAPGMISNKGGVRVGAGSTIVVLRPTLALTKGTISPARGVAARLQGLVCVDASVLCRSGELFVVNEKEPPLFGRVHNGTFEVRLPRQHSALQP